MERIKAYTTTAPNGGVVVDVEGMMVDIITVLKAGGAPKQEVINMFSEIWDNVSVSISIPKNIKN